MTESLTVRITTAADATALVAEQPREGLVEGLLAKAGDDFLVASAWRGEKVVGWGALELAEGEEGNDLSPEISDIYVVPSARRQGVARAVSAWLEQRARQAGHREVFLLVDPEREAAAIPLYLDLDYTPTGHHKLGEVVETGEKTHQAIYRKSLTISK